MQTNSVINKQNLFLTHKVKYKNSFQNTGADVAYLRIKINCGRVNRIIPEKIKECGDGSQETARIKKN